jgi:hypothetical protein
MVLNFFLYSSILIQSMRLDIGILVKCIDESKLSGLKETVKPNQGIIMVINSEVRRCEFNNIEGFLGRLLSTGQLHAYSSE